VYVVEKKDIIESCFVYGFVKRLVFYAQKKIVVVVVVVVIE